MPKANEPNRPPPKHSLHTVSQEELRKVLSPPAEEAKETISPWQKHVERWRNCRRCELAHMRKQVVLARGSIPCDILFIGEAPGRGENILGQPFVGPAGKLLDDIIVKALDSWQLPGTEGVDYNTLQWAFTNVVACIPLEDGNDKMSAPPDEACRACQPRLAEFIRIAKPRLLVLVGEVARDYLDPGYKFGLKLPKPIPSLAITHPAAILRMPIAVRSLAVRRCIVQIANACETHFPELMQE